MRIVTIECGSATVEVYVALQPSAADHQMPVASHSPSVRSYQPAASAPRVCANGGWDGVGISDGDTIRVICGAVEERVRFIGVDTPETTGAEVECYGPEATDFSRLLREQRVGLEFDVKERDQYGRWLAYVYFRGQMVNALLVKEGHVRTVDFQTGDTLTCFTSWKGKRKRRNAGCGEFVRSGDKRCHDHQNSKICRQVEVTYFGV